jgi:hypothetical protein
VTVTVTAELLGPGRRMPRESPSPGPDRVTGPGARARVGPRASDPEPMITQSCDEADLSFSPTTGVRSFTDSHSLGIPAFKFQAGACARPPASVRPSTYKFKASHTEFKFELELESGCL